MSFLGLHSLKSACDSKKKKKRVGRGDSSARGNKCGKGSNGGQQRSGYKKKLGFEGGQTPLTKRLPVIHRINKYRKDKPVTVTLDMIRPLFERGIIEINDAVIMGNRIIKKTEKYKIVMGKENVVPDNVHITANYFSKTAQSLIEQKKGKCIFLK